MRAVEYPEVPGRWCFVGRALPVGVALAAFGVAPPASAEQRAAQPPSATSAAVAAVLADVDAWLGQLTSPDASVRKVAVASLDSPNSMMLPAIAKHLADLKRTANRDAMAQVLARDRKGAGPEEEHA